MLKKTASLFIPSLLCLSVANALAQTLITTPTLAEADSDQFIDRDTSRCDYGVANWIARAGLCGDLCASFRR